MKSEELIEKLRAAQIDSETTGQPMRLDVKIPDLLDAFAEKDAQIASLKGEISKIQDKMCEDVFEGIMPSEHIVCLPLQQAAKRIAELKQSVFVLAGGVGLSSWAVLDDTSPDDDDDGPHFYGPGGTAI